MKTALWVSVVVLFCAPLQAATYYISPTGNDASAGTAVAGPWKTFAYAIPKLQPGDNLILLDGVYDQTNSGFPRILKLNGTEIQPITFKAQNERKAHIHNDGSTTSLKVDSSSYLNFEGLQLSSADNSAYSWAYGNSQGQGMSIYDSHHITVKRLLAHHSNRWGNVHLVSCVRITNSLFEECEFYYHHRHAVLLKPGDRNTFRRIYCNSRGYGYVSGAYPNGHGAIGGDVCISCYPAKSTIVENSIAEGHSQDVFDIQATGDIAADSNQFVGNVALNTQYGVVIKARPEAGATALAMPKNNLVKDQVILDAEGVGAYFRGIKGQRFTNSTVFNSAGAGIAVDMESGVAGDGVYSFVAENILTVNNGGYGFGITPNIQTWTADHLNSFGNTPNYNPATSVNYIAPSAGDPQLGSCRVWVPDNSPMKGAGKNGADIGANILYRYQDGVLTTQPLWDPATGEFPHGAIIAGINDVANQSLFDVNKRLNVNCNSCPFPASYPKPGSGSSITLDRAVPSPEKAFLSITPDFTGSSISIKTDAAHPSMIEIYNLQGKKIETLNSANGSSVQWHRGNQPGGVYFVKASSRGIAATAKMLVAER